MKKIHKPTDSELEILNILWTVGPASVRVIHERLSETKNIFYTTTLKTMQIMLEKGLLDRDISTRSHIYAPKVSKTDIQKNIVGRLKDTVFGGSLGQLIISAIGQGKPSKEELETIKSLIDQIEKDND